MNETLTYTLGGLLVGGRYFIAVTAVDQSDLESGCSSVASAVARSGGSPTGLVGGSAGSWTNGGSPAAIQVPVLTGLTAELGSQLPGTTVTFTAVATEGSASYQFKWWLWDGATWTVLGDWSSGNTFAWIPSTANQNYALGVRVRSAGSTADQPDSYPGSTRASGVIAFAIN